MIHTCSKAMIPYGVSGKVMIEKADAVLVCKHFQETYCPFNKHSSLIITNNLPIPQNKINILRKRLFRIENSGNFSI